MSLKNKLTAEQNQFVAEVIAQFLAENANAPKTKRIMLDTPHDTTDVYNHRLPLDMGEALIEMGKELNASRSYIVYHLLRYAITSGFTDQMESIVRLNSFQQYRNSFKK
jgi:hypothetical protein